MINFSPIECISKTCEKLSHKIQRMGCLWLSYTCVHMINVIATVFSDYILTLLIIILYEKCTSIFHGILVSFNVFFPIPIHLLQIYRDLLLFHRPRSLRFLFVAFARREYLMRHFSVLSLKNLCLRYFSHYNKEENKESKSLDVLA